MDKKEFCEKLKTARIEAGFKQEHVAKHMNLPISAISVMEAGSRLMFLNCNSLPIFITDLLNGFSMSINLFTKDVGMTLIRFFLKL